MDATSIPERDGGGSGAAAGSVLIAWAGDDPGLRSAARTLAGLLEAEPHRLTVVEADLGELGGGRSLVQALVSKIGGRVETAVLAAQAWQQLEPRLRGGPPRLVVALDAAAGSVLDIWRGKGLLRAPLVGVCCGLRLDPAWARTAVDRLTVADQVQAEAALGLGLPEEILVPCGIAVCGGFGSAGAEDREAHRRRFGLEPALPLVLVVTHGLDEETLGGALFQLSMLAERSTLLFDVARDDEGAELLRRRAAVYGISAQMFGKVEEAPQLWAASDLVVARPHLYVEQRALALRLPLVSVLPRGDEERETAAAWEARRIGRTVEHVSTLAAEVDLQLAPGASAAARQTMGGISRRTAAADVARFIAQARAQSEQLLAEVRRRAGAVAAESTPPPAKEVPRRGPLEAIGVAGDEPPGTGQTAADLEVAEAEASRLVAEHQRETERWSRRASLAAEKGEEELRAAADAEAQRHQAAMHRALAELGRLAERRQQLEPGRPARLDGAFRKLEIEQALEELKRKLE